MAVTLYEKVESRTLTVDRNTGGMTAHLIAVGSTNEAEVYQAAVLDTTVSYFGSLFRSAIRIRPRGGGPYWDVEIDYAPIPPGEAIQSPDLGGGGAGGEGPAQPQAPDPAQPVGPGLSFTTGGGTTRIFQNQKTISITRSLAAILANRGERDFHGAIGVTDDNGAEGVDIVSPNGEWSLDVRRARVTLNYFRTLFALTGSVNDARFWGFNAGELLYLGAEGRFSVADLWQITHKFAFSPNRLNVTVSKDKAGVPQITVPLKRGWDFLEVSYFTTFAAPAGGGPNVKVIRPEQAVVHEVYESANFALLEIGA